jgi:hypothetical protein
MIIEQYQITQPFATSKKLYNDAVKYFNSISTDESIERLAAVISVLNKRMFLIEQKYNRLIKLINPG